jgi:hypothetical protein
MALGAIFLCEQMDEFRVSAKFSKEDWLALFWCFLHVSKDYIIFTSTDVFNLNCVACCLK